MRPLTGKEIKLSNPPSARAWNAFDFLLYAFCIGCFAFVAVSAYLERTGQ